MPERQGRLETRLQTQFHCEFSSFHLSHIVRLLLMHQETRRVEPDAPPTRIARPQIADMLERTARPQRRKRRRSQAAGIGQGEEPRRSWRREARTTVSTLDLAVESNGEDLINTGLVDE